MNHLTETWRRVEGWPLSLAAAVGLTGGLLLGAAALLGLGGAWGLGLFAALLLVPTAVGWAARPVYVPLEAPPPPIERLLEMVPIPAGELMMGSKDDDSLAYVSEKPRHKVCLSAFEMARTPVTRRQYLTVMGWKAAPRVWKIWDDRRLPVNNIDWFSAISFCNALSEREGLKPCYTREGNQVAWDRQANGYRLPTEAEWEYACRAGTDTPWFSGTDEASLTDYAWFAANSDGKLQPVATKQPNPFKLYDMAGNVWEWCWDRYGEYTEGEQRDPIGPDGGNDRVIRGGSAWLDPRDLRSAYRYGFEPELRGERLGFRCVRAPAASD